MNLRKETLILSSKLASCKRILFDMWHKVEQGQFDSRSYIGDTALVLRDAIFENEAIFEQEYTNYSLPIEQKDNELKYYLYTGYVGNCLLFYAKHGRGYTLDICKAEIFTKEQAKYSLVNSYPKYKCVTKRRADKFVKHHVSFE
ncbi:MAG: hypothetical protein A2020_12265 [Lentisphaerae bacterium GWF2_45_14]|nr:MAG: hypothetical protein A2020_12265 [Lentisphaerae bacterium GWF2_45_14]